MIKEKSCGALVYYIRPDQQVDLLVLKHRLGGHWAFPKGHVENQESERETALREVKEETGLDIRLQSGYRKKVSYSPKRGVMKDVVYFLGESSTSEAVPQEEEISEIRWIPMLEADRYLTYRNDRRLLNSARRLLRRRGVLPEKEKK